MIHLRDMLCLSLVLLVASTEAFVHWAVQVEKGEQEAKRLAAENGFTYLGKVRHSLNYGDSIMY